MIEDNDFRGAIFNLPLEEQSLATTLVNEAEYVGRRLSTDVRVPGRIGDPKYFNFWKDDLKAGKFILDTISEGYKFPFESIPPPNFCKNNRSCLDNRTFVFAELLRLEALGCIKRVSKQPYVTLPLSVVFSKKLRVVVDASRHLNPYLLDRKVKLESLDICEQSVQQNDWQVVTDLDSGYWHVPLFPGHTQFVGVHFVQDDGTVIFWEWQTLFLGIKDAVYIFTKLLIPHKQYLRARGVRMSLFLDDQRVLNSDKEKCIKDNELALDTFDKAGWTVNKSKSTTEPVQCLKFLGLMNSTSDMKYYVPIDKKDSICDLIISILKKSKVHIKVLAKLLGKIQFCVKAMGPTVRLLCRSSHYLISKAKSWNSMIELSDLSRKELSYLLNNFESLNGFAIRPSLSTTCIDVRVSSDASNLGLCTYEVSDDKVILCKHLFSPEEASKSSTYRELLAFYYFYTSESAEKYRNCNLVHYTDNVNCATILSIGSRNPSLQPIVLEIFLAWRKLNICATVIHLLRDHPIIEFADMESRFFDLHDYSLDFDTFLFITQNFGPFDIDCFATKENKKCCLYYSKFQDEAALGLNFFVQKLPLVNLFVFPPVGLIIPALFHLAKFNSFGVLITPLWKSSLFWTFICNDGVHFNNFVTFFIRFSPFYVSGEHVLSKVFQGVKSFDSLILVFNFDVLYPFNSKICKSACSLGGCFKCI